MTNKEKKKLEKEIPEGKNGWQLDSECSFGDFNQEINDTLFFIRERNGKKTISKSKVPVEIDIEQVAGIAKTTDNGVEVGELIFLTNYNNSKEDYENPNYYFYTGDGPPPGVF